MAMRSWMRGAAPVAALALVAAALGAQAPKCDIPTQDPSLLQANLTFGGAFRKDAKPADKTKALAAAVKALTTNPEAIANQPGRNFLLGQVLLTWLEQPGITQVQPRGTIGYTTNPTGTVDLHAAIDSAFRAAREAKPECADSLRLYTLPVWGKVVNQAVDFLNKGELDSASVYAQRSIELNPSSHYGYQVMAGLSQTKDDTAMMVEWFTKGADIGLASKDTSARAFGESMLLNLGVMYQNASIDAPEPRKAEYARKAVDAYKRYSERKPDDMTVRLRIMKLAGTKLDAAGAKALVDTVAAMGDRITDAQLADVGNELSKNEQNAAALQVYEMALKRNPANRDALYNAAVALNNMERYDEIGPYFAKLRAVDPNNPGIYQLGQNTIRARRLAIQTKANKGVRPKPGQSVTLTPAQNAQMKVLQDSLLAYGKMMNDVSPVVQVTQFSPTAGGARFGAFVQVPPMKPAGTFTVTVEFLDAREQVVATGTATTKAIEPGSGEPVSVEGKGAGIVAFRYKVAK